MSMQDLMDNYGDDTSGTDADIDQQTQAVKLVSDAMHPLKHLIKRDPVQPQLQPF